MGISDLGNCARGCRVSLWDAGISFCFDILTHKGRFRRSGFMGYKTSNLTVKFGQ